MTTTTSPAKQVDKKPRVKPEKAKQTVTKPRVKPEKAQEVYQKILDELVKNYGFGLKEVPMDTLAAAVGYTHPRSDAMLAAMKMLKKDGIVIKKTNACRLSDQGIEEYVQEEEVAANPEAAMDQFWKQLEMKLASSDKSKGDKVRDAATSIWQLLQDGGAHDMTNVVAATSYGMERSTGFGEILKALKDLGFAQKADKKLQFTDKVFPFGRPGPEMD
jgi:hypothetical protein